MKGNIFRSTALKKEIVREVLSGRLSKSEAARKYQIKGSSSISYWITKFRELDQQRPLVVDYKKLSKEDLIKKLKKLERQLEDEQIRSDGYSKMIDIAEEQLQIDIRKKPDAKQSRK